MKLIKALTKTMCFLVFVVVLVAGGFLAGMVYEEAQDNPLPSLKEIQERIGAEPDGIWGPETESKWERAICNQYAAKYDWMYKEKK